MTAPDFRERGWRPFRHPPTGSSLEYDGPESRIATWGFKNMKQQLPPQSHCADCGAVLDPATLGQDTKDHRTPCPHCGSMKRTGAIVAQNTLDVLGLLKPTRSRENELGHVEILAGHDLLHEDGIALRKSRRNGKEHDRPMDHMTRKDGTGMHGQDHALSQRKGHGSARKP